MLRIFDSGGVPVVLSSTGVWAIDGAGPDARGVGSFGIPRRVPQRIGCVGRASALQTPQGILYRSTRGWRMVTGGLEIQDVGTPIEPITLGSRVDTRCVYHERTSEARCVSDGSTLVLNQQHGKWSEWTPFGDGAGVDCAVAGDRVWWTDGTRIAREFDRAAETISAGTQGSSRTAIITETPWIRFDGIAGFARLWRIFLRLRYLGYPGNSIAVELAYDGNAFMVDAFSFGDTDLVQLASTGGTCMLELHPSIQRIQSLKMRVTTYLDQGVLGPEVVAARLQYGVIPGRYDYGKKSGPVAGGGA